MVLSNVTKFRKILIVFDLESRRCQDLGKYVKYGRTGVTLNARAIIMAGA